jgi:hypothetical protein
MNKKDVTINFSMVEAAERAVLLANLSDRLTTLSEGGMDYGFFDGRTRELMFKLYEPIVLTDRKLYLVSLVSEKAPHPVVRMDRDGAIGEVPLDGGMLGGITFALIDIEYGAVVSLSQGGPVMGGFADLIRWMCDDPSAGLAPVFVSNVYDEVNQWEVYRKLEISAEAPAADFVDTILDSEYGSNFKILETLKGLKVNVEVSMGHGKGSLDKDLVRKFIKQMLKDNFAGKLKVSGKNFDEESTASHDLYNARLRYKTAVIIANNIIAPDEAKAALWEAYSVNLEEIQVAVERYENGK